MEPLFYRNVKLSRKKLNEKKRTVPAILSSDKPNKVRHGYSGFRYEVLQHIPSAVDLSRAKDGSLPLLKNHDSDKLVGIVENVRLRGNKLVGVLRFSNNSDGTEVFEDVKEGFLTGVSIGFSIEGREQSDDDDNVSLITKWTPHEASVTPIPADMDAQILRSNKMSKTVKTAKIKGKKGKQQQFLDEHTAQDEFTRQKDIRDMWASYEPQLGKTRYTKQVALCLDDPECDIETSRERLLKELGRATNPLGGNPSLPRLVSPELSVQASGDTNDFLRAATDSILIRHGVKVKEPHAAVQDLIGYSLLDMAKVHLGQVGVDMSRLGRSKLIERALTSSDFPLLLESIADKTVVSGYNEAPGTHRGWTTAAFARDFKDKAFVAASETPDLSLVNEAGEFKYGALTEDGSKVALATYGRLLAITRQALINDDTGGLIAAARNFGASAMRLESDLVYGNLIANPVMSDTKTLFHADHDNIVAASVPSVSSLGLARKLLRRQKGLAGSAHLDLQPFAILAPAALETLCEQLLSSLFDPFPAAPAGDSARNPFAGKLELIVDPRLDDDSETRWYVVTDPGKFNWAYRVFLDDNQGQPFVAEQAGWSVDGTELKIRHDFATLITEYRGIVKNDGA